MKHIHYNMSFVAVICCVFLVFFDCASTGSNGAPGWTRSPYIKYNKQTDVAVVGTGGNRQEAEKKAFANLAAFFGQSIKIDEKIIESYQEAEKNGITTSFGSTYAESSITTAAGIDSLVGAEIGDVWDDGKGLIYAVAVLNKSRAAQIYPNMIKANKEMIEKLVNMPDEDKSTLDGVARYKFAAVVADINISYGNLLSSIGVPELAKGLKKGGDYRLEAENIIKTIPVDIVVENDKSERVCGAFAKVFSDLGFIIRGNNPRYALKVKIIISPVEIPASPHKWTRIELSANLTDIGQRRVVLLPYNFSDRTGHSTQLEAENRAYIEAERRINEEYKNLLSGYLSRMLPKK